MRGFKMIDLSDKDFKSTLKETSLDDSNKEDKKYMTESELPAIDFDLVKRKYANSLGLSEDKAHSVDAIVITKDENLEYFIEFKNGKVEGKTKSNIRDKIRDTLLIYGDITLKNVSYTRKNTVFILVYNEEKNRRGKSLDKMRSHWMDRAQTEERRFDLEKFEDIFFKEVHTYTEKQFDNFLKEISSSVV